MPGTRYFVAIGNHALFQLQLVDTSLDKMGEPLADWKSIQKLVQLPAYARLIIKTLITIGRRLPIADHFGHRILFLHLESDLRMLAAFVYAHREASKGMNEYARVAAFDIKPDASTAEGKRISIIINATQQVCLSQIARAVVLHAVIISLISARMGGSTMSRSDQCATRRQSAGARGVECGKNPSKTSTVA